jgi:hypothetical protein
MRGRVLGLTMIVSLAGVPAAIAASPAPSLRGSPAAMVQQNRVAQDHGLDFYRSSADIREAVARGDLVELTGNEDYAVADFVRHPFLQPEAKLFVERLAAQYRKACGQKLVVTSAVRPSNGQPSNAHQLSVHPAGMAVDLRVSDRASCRSWLESTLLGLERRGVLNGIREFHPPHYHVAVFPRQYMAYVESLPPVTPEPESVEELPVNAVAEVLDGAGAAALMSPADGGSVPATATRGAPVAAWLVALTTPIGVGLFLRRLFTR